MDLGAQPDVQVVEDRAGAGASDLVSGPGVGILELPLVEHPDARDGFVGHGRAGVVGVMEVAPGVAPTTGADATGLADGLVKLGATFCEHNPAEVVERGGGAASVLGGG